MVIHGDDLHFQVPGLAVADSFIYALADRLAADAFL